MNKMIISLISGYSFDRLIVTLMVLCYKHKRTENSLELLLVREAAIYYFGKRRTKDTRTFNSFVVAAAIFICSSM